MAAGLVAAVLAVATSAAWAVPTSAALAAATSPALAEFTQVDLAQANLAQVAWPASTASILASEGIVTAFTTTASIVRITISTPRRTTAPIEGRRSESRHAAFAV